MNNNLPSTPDSGRASNEQARIMRDIDTENLRPFVVTKACAYNHIKPGDLLGIRPLSDFAGDGQYLILADGEPALFWATSNLRGAIIVRRFKNLNIEFAVTMSHDEFADLVLGKCVVQYDSSVFGAF